MRRQRNSGAGEGTVRIGQKTNDRTRKTTTKCTKTEKGARRTGNTTALCGNRWEPDIPKPFLKPGAFHLQQIQTVSAVKLERRLGALTSDEMKRVRDALAKRLGI